MAAADLGPATIGAGLPLGANAWLDTAAFTGGAVGPVVAALGAMRAQRDHPTCRWEEGALHGCGGGMLAGLAFGALALLAGGSVGPGRMTDIGPSASRSTIACRIGSAKAAKALVMAYG